MNNVHHLFVAVNLDTLPKYGPEDLNLRTIVDKQLKTEVTVGQLHAELNELKASSRNKAFESLNGSMKQVKDIMQALERQQDEFKSTTSTHLDRLNTVCNGHESNGSSSRDVCDRSMNLIIFGVAEDRDVAVRCNRVDDVLSHVVGREVDVTDMFRIGSKFTAGKM